MQGFWDHEQTGKHDSIKRIQLNSINFPQGIWVTGISQQRFKIIVLKILLKELEENID